MKYLIVFLLIVISSPLLAQSNELKAKAYYLEAESQYANGNSQSALTYLKSCLENLPNTNPKVEALYTRIYISLNQPNEAKKHLDTYFSTADESHSDYNDMLIQIIAIEKEDQRLKERAESEERRITQLELAEKKRREEVIRKRELENQQQKGIEQEKHNDSEKIILDNEEFIASEIKRIKGYASDHMASKDYFEGILVSQITYLNQPYTQDLPKKSIELYKGLKTNSKFVNWETITDSEKDERILIYHDFFDQKNEYEIIKIDKSNPMEKLVDDNAEKIILGYKCQKVTLKHKTIDYSMVLWFTRELPVKGFAYGIKGVVLESKILFGDKLTSTKVIDIIKTPIAKSEFDIPVGYKETKD